MRRLFEKHGTRDRETGRPCFDSQRALIAALEANGFAGEGSRSDGQELARRIERELASPADAVRTGEREKALIWTYAGARGARRNVLRTSGPTGPERTG